MAKKDWWVVAGIAGAGAVAYLIWNALRGAASGPVTLVCVNCTDGNTIPYGTNNTFAVAAKNPDGTPYVGTVQGGYSEDGGETFMNFRGLITVDANGQGSYTAPGWSIYYVGVPIIVRFWETGASELYADITLNIV